jgi:hypothetical protein
MIGDPTRGEETYPRLTLLHAAREWQNAIEGDRQLLPYHYSFEIGIGELKSRGSGGAGGFHIKGKIHSVRAGPGRCYLNEMGIRPDGRGEVLNRIDIRNEKKIETDDYGTLRVFRRKLKLTLFETVPQLVSFLSRCDDEVIRVRATENNPSFMDLVRAVTEGGGADDWAGEQILEMGGEGKRSLLERLKDPKAKKHYFTIAQLLLSLFPSRESRKAVERLVEREHNEELKRLYVVLLATAQKMNPEELV